jgi:LysM repeat protein
MSTPNPLIPQGTFQAQAGKGASNVRIAVVTIVAIHVVFFGGLLLQGCKRDAKTGANAETNASVSTPSLPPLDSGSLFYTNASHLPSDSTTSAAASNTLAPSTISPQPSDGYTSGPLTTSTAPRDAWRSTNLGGTPGTSTLDQTAGASKEYTIARGDTFGKIAAANGTTVNALKKANPTVDPAKIRPGMKIQIPAPAPKTASGAPDASGAAASGDNYTVKQGDTLTKVAKAHGVTVSQLRAANNLKTSNLQVGQKIKIPPPAPGGTPAPATRKTNTVSKARSGTNTLHTMAR